MIGDKHLPVPDRPWSQFVQPWGQDWQVGPKNPSAQDSHDVPVKPVGQLQEPDAEQTPAPEQGGEHDAD